MSGTNILANFGMMSDASTKFRGTQTQHADTTMNQINQHGAVIESGGFTDMNSTNVFADQMAAFRKYSDMQCMAAEQQSSNIDRGVQDYAGCLAQVSKILTVS